MRVAMLTTVDNPFDPFEDYPAWYRFDTQAGYDSASFLGRIVIDSEEMSEADQHLATEQAIDEIVRENVTGMYKKVVRDM